MQIDSNWYWSGACATGSLHISNDEGCQDRATAFEMRLPNDKAYFIVIVSDGAGSASEGGIGAAIACKQLAKCAKSFLLAGNEVNSITDNTVRDWLEVARNRISLAAETARKTERDFAATLVMAIVGDTQACFIQIGDGACVVKPNGVEDYQIPIWPMHGEYASQTYFITDPKGPHFKRSVIEAAITHLAVFTDGLEKLALVPKGNTADSGFFDALFNAFNSSKTLGRDRVFSTTIREWLDSEVICEKTHDDKTLILAIRNKRDVRASVSGPDQKQAGPGHEN